jgi:hypothetical protein
VQKVPIKNWLQERQRFDAKVELVDPPPDSDKAKGFSIHAVGTLDLPAGIERDYKFNIYAYHESSAQVRVTLISRETGEFYSVRLQFNFMRPNHWQRYTWKLLADRSRDTKLQLLIRLM